MTTKRIMAGLAFAMLTLGGCHKSADEQPAQPPADNTEQALPEATPPVQEPAAPANVAAAKPDRPAPPPELSADQQMSDDADATGMTARIDRNASGSTGSDAPPSTDPQ